MYKELACYKLDTTIFQIYKDFNKNNKNWPNMPSLLLKDTIH